MIVFASIFIILANFKLFNANNFIKISLNYQTYNKLYLPYNLVAKWQKRKKV